MKAKGVQYIWSTVLWGRKNMRRLQQKELTGSFLDKMSLGSKFQDVLAKTHRCSAAKKKKCVCRGGWQQMPSALLGIMGLFLHARHCDLLNRKHRGETNPISNGSISHISCQPRQKQEPWRAELNIKISLTCVRRQRFQGPEIQRPFLFCAGCGGFQGMRWDTVFSHLRR